MAIQIKARLAIGAILLAVGGAGAWYVMATVNERDELAAQVNAQSAQIERYELRVFALREEARLTRAAFEKVQSDDEQNRKELAEARTEIDRLVADIERGDTGLRVNATCTSNHMPDAATDTGLADGRTIELTPDARQDYYTLLKELEHTRSQVIGLQNYSRQLYQQCLGGSNGKEE